MSTVGHAIKTFPLFHDVKSILEFGSADGNTYKIVQPERYVGIDIDPTWYGVKNVLIERTNLYYWRPTEEQFDLVVCDAHGATDDPDLERLTLTQGVIAQICAKPTGLIVVDDCWAPSIEAGTIRALGRPYYKHPERTGMWIWRR